MLLVNEERIPRKDGGNASGGDRVPSAAGVQNNNIDVGDGDVSEGTPPAPPAYCGASVNTEHPIVSHVSESSAQQPYDMYLTEDELNLLRMQTGVNLVRAEKYHQTATMNLADKVSVRLGRVGGRCWRLGCVVPHRMCLF